MFQLCEITNQDSLYYNITVEEGEALLKSFFFLGGNMNSHYLYQIAKRNLKDLLEFITQQQKKLDKIDTLECNRLLYNYIDTFYSFVNYYESHYKEEFAGIKRKFYDTYFEYRFIYNLRNYMVHESLGILKVTKEIYPDTILVKFIVETNRLISSNRVSNKMKDELKTSIKDEIDIGPILKNHLNMILKLHEDMLLCLQSQILEKFAYISKYIKNKNDTFLLSNDEIVNSLLNVTSKFYKCVADNFVYDEKFFNTDTDIWKFFLKLSFAYYGQTNVIYNSEKTNS